MVQCHCLECRMLWAEDRGQGNSPIGPHAYLCPRCGQLAKAIIIIPENQKRARRSRRQKRKCK